MLSGTTFYIENGLPRYTPKPFIVNGEELNEYELRALQILIKKGIVKAENYVLNCVDPMGGHMNVKAFREDGTIIGTPYNNCMALGGALALDLHT